MTDPRCQEVQALIPELALGVAPGPERASALTHIAGCTSCRSELERVAQTVDELLLLAPEVEPPSGFETRVLESLIEKRSRTSRRSLALVAVAASFAIALAGVAGFGLSRWSGSSDRVLADEYQRTLDVADGTAFRAADLTTTSGPTAGASAGHAFMYDGSPSWVFMTVSGVPSNRYQVRLVADDGATWNIGICRVRDGYQSWGTAVDVPLDQIDHLEMRSGGGAAFTAEF
ncbi:MAG TPA: zf-HC2 domain-containing protein [Actinomycetes bacterium]|nr:zf-HC2 domain-containing protein [Actinomycetes bacterium]